jgi:mitotic spindle assembly checkpoint protein MAD2
MRSPSHKPAASFDILVYADKSVSVPESWEDSDARQISGNPEYVKLRSFSTSVHRVDALVAYKLGDGL